MCTDFFDEKGSIHHILNRQNKVKHLKIKPNNGDDEGIRGAPFIVAGESCHDGSLNGIEVGQEKEGRENNAADRAEQGDQGICDEKHSGNPGGWDKEAYAHKKTTDEGCNKDGIDDLAEGIRHLDDP